VPWAVDGLGGGRDAVRIVEGVRPAVALIQRYSACIGDWPVSRR
jgi:hypothetical protein